MAWADVQHFGHCIYTVGDGTRRGTVSELNTLSKANCERAVQLLDQDDDAVLFIAGGNGAECSPRPNAVAGALPEGERMRLYIERCTQRNVVIVTDCDPEFWQHTGFAASGNTPENSRNVVAFLQHHPHLLQHTDIVAEHMHLPRVIATFRRKLSDCGLLADAAMIAHAVIAPFDPESCQGHLRSRVAFRRWEVAARIHHLMAGHVIRREFLSEWLSGREYAYLCVSRVPATITRSV
jgi:hypothetical protein